MNRPTGTEKCLSDLYYLAKSYQALYDIHVMQDMSPSQLKKELDPELYYETIRRRNEIETIVRKASKILGEDK